MAKKRPTIDASRLKILAAGDDEHAFLDSARDLLASGDRTAREAALAALEARALPAARPALRALYAELDADGPKRDQGCTMREAIVRILGSFSDLRDVDIAIRASHTDESIFGDDTSWRLRANGLRMLATLAPERFPYYAVEHLDDASFNDSEPANTAFQLLAATGNHVAIYQWLISGDRPGALIAQVIDLLPDAPGDIIERYISRTIGVALRTDNESLAIALADAVVEREMASSFPALEQIMSAKISDELYRYLAVLLARTNTPALLAILEGQLHRGRRPRIVADALRIRPTPEQKAILKRWEDGDDV